MWKIIFILTTYAHYPRTGIFIYTVNIRQRTNLEQPRDKGLVEPSSTVRALSLALSGLSSQELLLLTINDILSGVEVGLMGLDTARLGDELVAKDEDQVHGNTKVTRDESLVLLTTKDLAGVGIPDENIVVLGEGDENAHGESSDGSPHAEGGNVGKSFIGETLSLLGTAPPDVSCEDRDPGHETEDGGEVDKVTENLGRVVGNVHVGQETERSRHGKGVDGNTVLVSLLEDSRGRTVGSKTVEGTASNVQVRVGGGEDEDADTSVDDVREDLDTGDIGSDDEWRGRSTGLGLGGKGKLPRVVGDDHSDEEDGETVEEEDSVEGELDGAGHGLAGVLSLSDRYTDELSSKVGKCSVDHAGPETEESSSVASHDIRLEGAVSVSEAQRQRGEKNIPRVAPVSETLSVVVRTTAKSENQREEDDSNDDDDLERGKPELEFTKESNTEIVDDDDGD